MLSCFQCAACTRLGSCLHLMYVHSFLCLPSPVRPGAMPHGRKRGHGSTAMDTLWGALPFVSLPEEKMAARVGKWHALCGAAGVRLSAVALLSNACLRCKCPCGG